MSESTNSYRKRTYGVGDDWFDAQLSYQNGVCAICKGLNPPRTNGDEQLLVIDHNHRTNATRGLLCQRCNKLIGFAEAGTVNGQEILIRALSHLREYDGSAIPSGPFVLPEPVCSVCEQVPDSVQSVNNGEGFRF